MTPAHRFMRAQGLGDDIINVPWQPPDDFFHTGPLVIPGSVGTPPTFDPGGSSWNWNQFANTIGASLVGIFGQHQQQQPTGNPNVVYASSPSGAGSPGVGISLDGQGIRLSDGTHISWLLILGGVGVFMLLQHPGYRKR